MAEKPTEFMIRTEQLALRIITLFSALPKTTVAQVLGKQVLRSGTSVGAQVAEANHSKSTADFVSKIDGARQEVEETLYWLRLIIHSKLVTEKRLAPLLSEANEVKAILMTMSRNARRRLAK